MRNFSQNIVFLLVEQIVCWILNIILWQKHSTMINDGEKFNYERENCIYLNRKISGYHIIQVHV